MFSFLLQGNDGKVYAYHLKHSFLPVYFSSIALEDFLNNYLTSTKFFLKLLFLNPHGNFTYIVVCRIV
jgi:hypothetical protein